MLFLKALFTKYKQGIVLGAALLLGTSLLANYIQHQRYQTLNAKHLNLTSIYDSLSQELKKTRGELASLKTLWDDHSKSKQGLYATSSTIDSWYVTQLENYYTSEIERLKQPHENEVVIPKTEPGLIHKPTQIGYDALWQQYCALYEDSPCENGSPPVGEHRDKEQ